jgi:hypothetical protein
LNRSRIPSGPSLHPFPMGASGAHKSPSSVARGNLRRPGHDQRPHQSRLHSRQRRIDRCHPCGRVRDADTDRHNQRRRSNGQEDLHARRWKLSNAGDGPHPLIEDRGSNFARCRSERCASRRRFTARPVSCAGSGLGRSTIRAASWFSINNRSQRPRPQRCQRPLYVDSRRLLRA